jgi:hypothetical protein
LNTERALRPTSLPSDPDNDYLDPLLDGSDILFLGFNIKNLSSAAPSGSATVQIDFGVEYYWYGITAQADITAGGNNNVTESTIVNPLVKLDFNIASSHKSLNNVPLPVSVNMGISGGERYYRPLRPRRFGGGTTIQLTATAFVVAGTTYNNLLVTLHGYTLPMGS